MNIILKSDSREDGMSQKVISFILTAVFLASCGPSAGWIDKEDLDLSLLAGQLRNEFGIPALAVGVVNSEKVLKLDIQGVGNMETGAALPEDPRFHLGSVSKTITGYIAGRLVKEGKISWDTMFFDLFPGSKETTLEGYHEKTLVDFLSHRAGIAHRTQWKDFIVPPGSAGEQRIAYAEWAMKIKPENKPFSSYNYSNGGIVIAAAMLEKASGTDFEELVQEYLNDDYGIDAQLGFPVYYGEDQPRGYMPESYLGGKGDRFVLMDTEYVNSFDDVLIPSGGYNMMVSVFVKYVQMHLSGLRGRDKYLDKADFEYLHFGIKDYSLCWENGRKFGYLVSEHSGSSGNFFCYAVIIPEIDLGIIIMANSGILNAFKPLEAAAGYRKLEGALKTVLELWENESL